MRTNQACVAGLLLAVSAAGYAQTPSNEELYRIIQQQQAQIEQLRDELRDGGQPAQEDPERARLEGQIERQQQQIDALAERSDAGGESALDRTYIGGYGELHYNNFDNRDDEIDFHRFVLEFGHQFNDDWRFFSELEFEHAFLETTEVEVEERNADGAITELEVERTPGELELEQAWVERDLGQRHALRGGVDLIPVGIINPTHEPTTFYGVERNRIETRIIPSTWREGGLELIGRPGATGLSYKLFLHSGFGLQAEDDFEIRDGRQNVAEAASNDFASTAQIKYTGIPGLTLAASLQYQDDVTQDGGDGLDDALLYEAHLTYSSGIFGLRALYSEWDFNGAVAEANDRERQFGWYVEPAVKILPELGFFARYAALEETENLTEENITFGLNYWPIQQVVLKADYQFRETDLIGGGTFDDDSFNAGLGYVFP